MQLHELDTTIPKFISGDAAVKYMFLYLTGLLPFWRFGHHEVAALPYMTRDYLRMKLIEARELTPYYYPFIFVVVFSNRFLTGMLEHMGKRGLHTNYWVINDEDEIRKIVNSRVVQGVMSDRPSAVLKIVREG